MNIVVLIKQVPDSAEVKIDSETGTLIREGVPSIVNPYDLHAVEAALKIKEEKGGRVTALTMGPPQAEQALRDVIAMGVDDGILLTSRAYAGADTLATSYALSKAIEKLEADIVLCGKQAIDGDTAQVGPEVAEMLGIPNVSYVRNIREVGERSILVERMMEEGYDVVESELPALFTVVRELNKPRMQSLKGKMAAKKKELRHWGPEHLEAEEARLGFSGSPTQVKNVFAPEKQKNRVTLEGSAEEQVDALLDAIGELKCR